MLTRLETELVWLAKRVNKLESLVERVGEYFDTHQQYWSEGFIASFLADLRKLKDHLYFEQSQLERVAWLVVEERERRS